MRSCLPSGRIVTCALGEARRGAPRAGSRIDHVPTWVALAGIFESLPRQFESFQAEPAFDTANSTFCIWRAASDASWSCGVSSFPDGEDPDGSERLLSILDGIPQNYSAFASWYYEVDIPLASIEAVYRHEPLTAGLLATLNPAVTLATLEQDLTRIGYTVR